MGPFFFFKWTLGSSLLGNFLKLFGWWFFLSLFFPFYLLNSCDPDVTTSRTVSLIFSSFLLFSVCLFALPSEISTSHFTPSVGFFYFSYHVPKSSFCFWTILLYFNSILFVLCFPGGSDSKESACSAGDPRFNPWVGKIAWRRKWLPTPVFLPGEFHGQRSLVGYSSWDRSQTWLSNKHFDFFFLKFHAGSIFSISDNTKFSPLYIDFLLYTVFLFSFFGHHLSY